MSGFRDAGAMTAGDSPPAAVVPGAYLPGALSGARAGADLIGARVLDLDSSEAVARVGVDVPGVQAGADYTLSLRASDMMAEGDSFRIFWNGAPVETPEGGLDFVPPAGDFQTYTLRLTGGSGDGSNRLEFEGQGGEVGVAIAIEEVRLIGPRAADDSAPEPAGEVALHDVAIMIEGGATPESHSLGAYLVSPDTGELGAPQILFESTLATFHGGPVEPGTGVALSVPEGAQIGLFLIRGGGQANDYDALGPGTLAFLTPDGDPATLSDVEADLVHIAPDGSATPLAGAVQHAAQPVGAEGGFRPLALNEDGTLFFGFAGGPAGQGEAIYQDLWISVAPGSSGALVLGADGVAHGAPVDAESILPDEDPGAEDPGAEDDAPDDAAPQDGSDTAGLLVLVPTGRMALTPETDITAFPEEVAANSPAPPASAVPAPVEMSLELAAAVIVPCFTPGTLIDTADGRVPVETLRMGDRVLTRDNGFQPLEWVGRKDVSRDEMVERPRFRGVRIRAGALGPNLPERDMVVSPQHRVLLIGPEAELMFGVHEVLAPAIHMIGIPGVIADDAPEISYIHIMCRRHEIVRSDGLWSESFQPGDLSLAGLDQAQRNELLWLFPDLATRSGRQEYASARRSLHRYETMALLAPRRPLRPARPQSA